MEERESKQREIESNEIGWKRSKVSWGQDPWPGTGTIIRSLLVSLVGANLLTGPTKCEKACA